MALPPGGYVTPYGDNLARPGPYEAGMTQRTWKKYVCRLITCAPSASENRVAELFSRV